MQYVTQFFLNFLGYDVNLISNSDTLYEAILQIETALTFYLHLFDNLYSIATNSAKH